MHGWVWCMGVDALLPAVRPAWLTRCCHLLCAGTGAASSELLQQPQEQQLSEPKAVAAEGAQSAEHEQAAQPPRGPPQLWHLRRGLHHAFSSLGGLRKEVGGHAGRARGMRSREIR